MGMDGLKFVSLFAILFLLFGCADNSQPAASINTSIKKNTSTGVEPMKDIAILETSKGNIEIELNREKAPATVANFISYVKSGQYDGTVFHRVIPGFMIQGGGFTADGTQKPTNAPIKLESSNGLKNEIGTVAMARTNDPNSATCQFFINVADNTFLNYAPNNPGYAVFGKVTTGIDVMNVIAKSQTGNRGPNSDWPVQDITIKKAYMK